MVIKKTASPQLPPVHPGLQQRLREAEEAEKRGETPRGLDKAHRVLRPSLDTITPERADQAHAIGLVEPAYKDTEDGRAALAEQAAFRPGEDLDVIWDELSEGEKIRAGATERFRLEMESTLRQAMMPHALPHQITGRLDARTLRRSEDNLLAELASLEYLLAPDSYGLLKTFIYETREVLEVCIKHRLVAGIDAIGGYSFLRDLLHKLLYQELASRRRAMGDRGVRRICTNVALGERLLLQHKKLADWSPRSQILFRVICVHLDLGLTAYAARVSYRGTKLHRNYGARIFLDEMNRYRALLSYEEMELVRLAVGTHSSEELPFASQRLLAIVRGVDHLAPLAPHRVYKHFESLPAAVEVLDAMLEHQEARRIEAYLEEKRRLREVLGACDIAPALRDDLYAAFRPIERQAEPVDLGELAGEVSELVLDLKGDGVLRATLTPDAFARRYQVLFDQQQDQLVNVGRATGVTLPALQKAQGSLRFTKAGLGALELVRG